ncbi:hypothetical protein AVEN_202836-1 [Araneus ventricosus]|uniref:Uncharacterized protein n=1 Tax=Araneus ventricosus TaxID=182803 RepID=A0A4Y2DNS5_ARAVE|nr:hypothetical protein AVEN_202836-1 [Araneus ventricosus]
MHYPDVINALHIAIPTTELLRHSLRNITIVLHELKARSNLLKLVIHFTDKLDILVREKEKDIKSIKVSQMACGDWNSVWTEIGAKTAGVSHQRDPERG